MMRSVVGYFLVALSLTLGGCVVYGHHPGYYDYPRFQRPHYYYWGPPIHFRFHYHRGWHGLNEEDGAIHPVFRLEYWDAPFMCVDPEYVETSQG